MQIENPYHIYTNSAAKGLIPTQLRVTDSTVVESIDYPSGESRRFAFADEVASVYSGTIQIAVRFRQPVTKPIEMALEYQACDDNACLAPVIKRFEVPAP